MSKNSGYHWKKGECPANGHIKPSLKEINKGFPDTLENVKVNCLEDNL